MRMLADGHISSLGYLWGNVQYLYRPISAKGLFRTFDSITCSLMLFSFRRTRFRASSSRKSLGREQKRGVKGEAKPTILKNCVCPRTQLLIVAVLWAINTSISNNPIGKLMGSIKSCVIWELSWISVRGGLPYEPDGDARRKFWI